MKTRRINRTKVQRTLRQAQGGQGGEHVEPQAPFGWAQDRQGRR